MQNKTLNQHISEGYNIPNVVDSPTKQLIIDWFGDRFIPEKFDLFFGRAIALHYPYYRQLLRVDPTVSQFDWLVENYLEHQTYTKNEGESIKSGTGSATETTVTDIDNLTTNSLNGSHSDNKTTNGSDTRTSKGSATDSGTEKADTRALENMRLQPMSATLEGDVNPVTGSISVSGLMNPAIVNPSQSNDGLTSSIGMKNGNSSHDDIDNSTTSYSDEDVGSHSENGTSKFEGDMTNTVTKSNSTGGTDTSNSNSLFQEISTGRSNGMADLLGKAKNYIMTTESWIWFYRQLDKCFLSIYDLEED